MYVHNYVYQFHTNIQIQKLMQCDHIVEELLTARKILKQIADGVAMAQEDNGYNLIFLFF